MKFYALRDEVNITYGSTNYYNLFVRSKHLLKNFIFFTNL